MVGMMSAGEIVKLTQLGNYRMDAPAKGPLALLKKLRGIARKPGGNSGAGQMKMLRRLPKMLRFIPGTAQDVRAYFLTLQYWLAGSDDNVVAMVRALIDRYADGDRAVARGHHARPKAPREYPETSASITPHPAAHLREHCGSLPAANAKASRHRRPAPAALLSARPGLRGHYDGVIARSKPQGLKVIPAFASGLDARPAIEAIFMARMASPPSMPSST